MSQYEDPSQEDVNQEIEETAAEEVEANAEAEAEEVSPQDEDNSDANENEGEEPEETPEEQQPPRKKNSATSRIKRLNAAKKAAEEKAERLERRLAEYNQQDDDFDEFDINSVVKRSSQETAAIMQKQQAEEAREEAARYANEQNEVRLQSFQEAEADFIARVPDYDQVISQLEFLAKNEAAASLIIDSEKGPEVAYYLGKHPNEALAVAQMSPLEAAKKIGNIEARLTAPAPRTATRAPNPVPKVSGKSGSSQKDPSLMSPSEFRNWRQGRK